MTDQQTRDRILLAAAELFVKTGFQKTTVRSICQAAGANVAAVNYHFQGKKGLYEAVVDYALAQKPEVPDPPGAPAAERLRLWIHTFVFSCVGAEPDLLSQIMAVEMTKPTSCLEKITLEMIVPRMAHLQEIIQHCAETELPPSRIRLLAFSVVGQVMLYDHSRPVIGLLFPEMTYSDEQLTMLVDHITQASLGMISAIRETSCD